DFNLVLSPDEKRRGRPIFSRCQLFQKFVHSNDLRDLDFKGPQFNWRRGVIFERLDWAIGNTFWISHPDFAQFVCDNWRNGSKIYANLISLTTDLKRWNTKVYGQIIRRKRSIAHRI
ncbi:hypothetical protein J1N35_014540, partial [Gossypium stocksii]